MKYLLGMILFMMTLGVQARVAIFDGNPIEIYLSTTQRTGAVLRFDEPQRIGLPPELASSIQIRPSGNFVSIKLINEFDGEIIFQGIDTGEVIYAKIQTVNEYETPDEEVIIRKHSVVAENSSETASDSVKPQNRLTPRETVEVLSRAVAQRFGPLHAIESTPFPIAESSRNYPPFPIEGLYRQAGINMTPVKTFTGGGLLGTVFIIENTSTEDVVIDPAKIRGKWIAVDLRSDEAILKKLNRALVTLIHVKPFPSDLNSILYEDAF